MNINVLLIGFLITSIFVLNTWIGKYIFFTKIDRAFKKNAKQGTAKVLYHTIRNNSYDSFRQKNSKDAFVELYDENGNSLGKPYYIPILKEIGSIINVEYIESKIMKYKIRPIGYKDNTGNVSNILIIMFIILGLVITIPLAFSI